MAYEESEWSRDWWRHVTRCGWAALRAPGGACSNTLDHIHIDTSVSATTCYGNTLDLIHIDTSVSATMCYSNT